MSDSSDAPLHNHSLRRSFTLPTKLNPTLQRRSSESLKPSENDLFYHPSAKVVHFAPRALAPIPSSTTPSDFDYPVDTVETLPWRSPTERTVALAPLRLEKVYGSTVFLKCGTVVHAILKNSQCWCVDGESTFVLRIRPLTYYRIELPNETDEDKALVSRMKEALPTILRYEVTPCPFKRGFTIEIPEEAKIPRRKRAWRPKSRRESAPISSTYCQDTVHAKEEATPDSLSAGEDTDGNATDDSGRTTTGSDSTILETIPDDSESPETVETLGPIELPRRSVSETQKSFQSLLASFEDTAENTPEPQDSSDLPLSSSVDSFHSLSPSLSNFESYSTSPSPTSADRVYQNHGENYEAETSAEPTFLDVDFSGTRASSTRERDDKPLAPSDSERDSYFESKPRLPRIVESSATNHVRHAKPTELNPHLSSMSVEFRRRSRASREREISPMPAPSTLVLANPSEKNDAASIIQKACTVVLVPPIQLLIVLIHIAARIVIGPALNSISLGDLDRKFECQVSDPQEAVDDYDLPLAPDRTRKASTVSERMSYSDPWDLD